MWACFAALSTSVNTPPDADIAGLSHLLATGVAVVALVLITLSVVHTQVSGLRPNRSVVAVVALGVAQGRVAAVLSGGGSDLWGPAGHLFELIGVAVALAWVGGQFQQGVRRQRVEDRASMVASWIERARQQAHHTVDSAYRHDVRSMLFVIDGAARALSDPSGRLSDEDRVTFAAMLTESVQRLTALADVRSEEIQPMALAGVVKAVVQAERRAGRTVVAADAPAGLTASGRAADVAAALRTLLSRAGRRSTGRLQIRSEADGDTILVHVEPVGADPLPLSGAHWEQIHADTFKFSIRDDDEERVDLFVAARLLDDQGADLWSAAGRARFAVRLPAVVDSGPEVKA